jgi:hypothetical protein
MKLFSIHFELKKTQAELDFVDIPIDKDLPLFIDPFALSLRQDRWSQQAHATLIAFFEKIIEVIRNGDLDAGRQLLQHLKEPNETRLGLSKHRPRGRGIGRDQAADLFDALRDSSAVQTGFLKSLEECELLVEGIGRDKISDLTTNVIRGHLAEYSKDQCDLLNIATQSVPVGPYYSHEDSDWKNEFLELPVVKGRPLLLVPKAIVRFDPSYDHQKYYREVVLSYLQAEHLHANSGLVKILKNGKHVVRKKDVAATFPCTKENLFAFSRAHPEALQQYRDRLAILESQGPRAAIENDDEELLAEALKEALASIPAGGTEATTYHRLMIGMAEFIFYPNLLHPRKEIEIHQGRKRIDIVMENGAATGIFLRLHRNRGLPCAFVAFECKNYTTEVANPELDQLAGRFSPNRGKVGFLCCRKFEDRSIFIERSRDTFRDDRGLIIPLDDATLVNWLDIVAEGKRKDLDDEINHVIDEVWYS